MKTCPTCRNQFDNGNKKFCSQKCSLFVTNDLSPFRWFLKRIKLNCYMRSNRLVKVDPNLTIHDLKEIWEKQNGTCPFTGWKLKFKKNTNWQDKLDLTPDRASIDRIDSKKDYTKENVQFISYMAQIAKNVFSEEQLLHFCDSVTSNIK